MPSLRQNPGSFSAGFMCTLALLFLLGAGGAACAIDDETFRTQVRPILQEYCLKCHSTEKQKGDIDLEVFASIEEVKKQPKIWQSVSEQLAEHEMPPKEKPQPPAGEREKLAGWTAEVLDTIAREHAGDPGPVVLRRLSNAEYTYTMRDLLAVDGLDPAREFPVDGAAGEGFTNTGQALVMSPALVTKYLDAAKEAASHMVLLPDGVRFSEKTTRRDWTEELMAEIRGLYRKFTDPRGSDKVNLQGIVFETNGGGRLPLEKYFLATLVERAALQTGSKTCEQIAAERGLSSKYLATLYTALAGCEPSLALGHLRERWRAAGPGDAATLAGEVAATQKALWKFNPVGQLGKIGGAKSWMEAILPKAGPAGLLDGTGASPESWSAACETLRALFPAALCYEKIVPVDEVITLTLFHREDEPLIRLMLNDPEKAKLDRLWAELRYVSQDALTLVDVFTQLLEYASQDADPKVFAPLRKPIFDGAAAFREQLVASEPRHLEAVLDFAGRAYRHPLSAGEEKELRDLYQKLRREELPHDAAIRLTLARVLVAPAFLYRSENPGPGTTQVPVSDWELASRLSYFLWSSQPDAELWQAAAAGRLHDPTTLRAETHRLLADGKVRRLALEFACRWLHIHGFDGLDEKSERHFPTFAALRAPMYEESIRFFTDLFQRDGSVLEILDADHTFLNGALAEYYGIPGVTGEEWRRIDGVKKYARGGILAQATTLAQNSGASRTSPILRGHWIAETLLGDKLPRPPKDVPPLPAEEATETLTVRELTEKHSSDPRCAHCHDRMDAFGFALEGFDAIGRSRERDLADHPVQTAAKLKDGAEIAGLAGLREYLLTTRRAAFLHQVCRKLLGYALGRSVQLSDEPLLTEMQSQLQSHGFRISVAIDAIVQSRQFLDIRGREQASE